MDSHTRLSHALATLQASLRLDWETISNTSRLSPREASELREKVRVVQETLAQVALVLEMRAEPG